MLIGRWPRGSPTKSRSHVMENNNETLITLTADIVSAHVSNNTVAVNDLPTLIQNVHGALAGAGAAQKPVDEKPQPAVSVRRSEEHTSELQSLMRISYAVFCLKKKNR